MKEWEFTYQEKPKTPEESRETRRQEAWENACENTRKGCVDRVSKRLEKKDSLVSPEVQTFAIAAFLAALLSG